MTPQKFCQSCSMPLDNNEIRGTEKDGSFSDEYCIYCYKDGAFTIPGMSIDEMRTMVETQMKKRNLPAHLITMAVNALPGLRRWKNKDL